LRASSPKEAGPSLSTATMMPREQAWRIRVRRSASEEGVDQLVALGRALCDPIRVRKLSMMADGRSCCDFSGSGVPADEGEEGICVCEFEEVFGMGQSKVSYHVKKLKDAGLVREKRRGK
jgi:ArsR family transcriptional regulator